MVRRGTKRPSIYTWCPTDWVFQNQNHDELSLKVFGSRENHGSQPGAIFDVEQLSLALDRRPVLGQLCQHLSNRLTPQQHRLGFRASPVNILPAWINNITDSFD